MVGKVIGVISLKGGVGKTSVVTSIGAALADFGKKVLLIDGNLSSPSLGLHLGVVEPEKTLHHVLARNIHPSSAVYSRDGIDIMPASIFGKFDVNPLSLRDKVKFFKKTYDVIVIDSSPSLDAETLAVILASDELIAVTTPDHSTLSATIKAVKLAKQRGTPISGIVLNKVHGKNFEISIKDIEKTLDIPVLAVIPYDTNVLKALSNMKSIISQSPNSKGTSEYRKLSAVLIGEKYKPFDLREFFGFAPRQEEINREIFYENVFK